MKRFAITSVLLGFVFLLRPAAAEVFVLSSGGRIEGELLNPDEKPREAYQIKLLSGGQMTLKAEQVKEVLSAGTDRSEYEKVRPQYPDTVEGQWKLAEWCREHQLSAQRKTHMERVIELDPNHVEARRALGYYQIEGKWITQKEAMESRGYRLYKGKYMLPQQIELLESRRKQDLAEKEWFQKIQRWRGWLNRDKDRQARENIRNIDDPVAVKALASAMNPKHESNEAVRLLFVEALGHLKSPESAMALAIPAIDDPNDEVRLSCLDWLEKREGKDHKMVVEYFITRLRAKDNATINRAAIALNRMKDKSAVGPLIQVLTTTHKQTISPGSNGAMSMSFSSNGGMGMGMNQKPKVVAYTLNNQAVLDALVTLTGQNFSYNQRAWNTWFGNQKKADTVDARRG